MDLTALGIGILFLIAAITFALVILTIGFIEKEEAKARRRSLPGQESFQDDQHNEWYVLYVLGKWPEKKKKRVKK